jgi:hypothetical protein
MAPYVLTNGVSFRLKTIWRYVAFPENQRINKPDVVPGKATSATILRRI